MANQDLRDSGKPGGREKDVGKTTSRSIINELEFPVNLFFIISVVFLNQSPPAWIGSSPLSPHRLHSSGKKASILRISGKITKRAQGYSANTLTYCIKKYGTKHASTKAQPMDTTSRGCQFRKSATPLRDISFTCSQKQTRKTIGHPTRNNKEWTMKTLINAVVTAAASLLLSSNAMALSFDGLAGQTVKLSNGLYGTTDGGEFIIDVQGMGTTQDFISFCLERNEYINYTSTFTIKNVADYAEAGGIGGADDGKDYVDDKTKWVFWNYLQGTFGVKTDALANAVQTAIWYYENELSSLGIYESAVKTLMARANGNYSITGDVKVLNLTYSNGTYAQSQLVAAPVPEPTTMLLFGTGLIGLAGIARRRQNA